MKFLADMGVSPRTVDWLREQGHDATHLFEEGLERLPDDDILAKARAENRIVLTMDLDFGYFLAVSGETLPSVIIFRQANKSPGTVNARLAEILVECADDLEQGAIISVGETSFRIRNLPT